MRKVIDYTLTQHFSFVGVTIPSSESERGGEGERGREGERERGG